ncbi:MAG: hypothetical protein IJ222_05340 [Bacteroidales bacterium]|nr:hypothetical protein [Bacteroidales bacterium]
MSLVIGRLAGSAHFQNIKEAGDISRVNVPACKTANNQGRPGYLRPGVGADSSCITRSGGWI